MKDALGHGSNNRGGSSVVVQSGSSSRGVMPARPFRESQGPVTSNAEAAASLMSSLKSTQAPVHDAHDYGRTVGSGPSSRPANAHPDSTAGRRGIARLQSLLQSYPQPRAGFDD